MHFSSFVLAALAGIAQAVEVQVVSVGKSATNQTGLKFYPETITAAVGTTVQFQFWVGNHTVTQSNFDNACVPINNINSSIEGIYSGYMPVEASASMNMIPTFTITIKDTKPIWLYCSQGKHCQGGMSMVINENTTANASRSLSNYKTIAATVADSNEVPGDSSSGDNSGSDGSTTTVGSTTPTSTDGASSTESVVTGEGSRVAFPCTALFALAATFLFL